MSKIRAVIAYDAGGEAHLGSYGRCLAPGSGVKPYGDVGGNKVVNDSARWIAQNLKDGPVAVGIEAPCWVPITDGVDMAPFMRKRYFEGQRSWSAPAGCYVGFASRVLIQELVNRLHHQVGNRLNLIYGTEGDGVPEKPGDLLVWEAFVTDDRKPLKSDLFAREEYQALPAIKKMRDKGELEKLDEQIRELEARETEFNSLRREKTNKADRDKVSREVVRLRKKVDKEDLRPHIADAFYVVEDGFVPLLRSGVLDRLSWPERAPTISSWGDAFAQTTGDGSKQGQPCMVVAPSLDDRKDRLLFPDLRGEI